jgi:peroxiredoxin
LFLSAALLLPSTLLAQFADRAEDVHPLLPGSAAPSAEVQRLDGSAVDFQTVLNGKPTLLVFYRGGWCPYCNVQLSALRTLVPDLDTLGFQLIAVSPDRPEELGRSLDELELEYQLVSDATAELMQSFGIAFQVDEATRAKYREYNIDLAKASGHDHYALPVPSVFVIDGNGVIQFGYSNPDYRTRVPERLIRAAMEATQAGEFGKSVRE